MVKILVPWTSRFPRSLGNFERNINELMGRFFGAANDSSWAAEYAPSLNVSETENEYEVTVELPGMKPDEINVEMHDGRLWITGERKCETEETDDKKTFHRIERRYGKFQRVITLGDVDADKIHAEFKDGILRVTAPKAEAVRPKRIDVKA